MAAGYCFGCRTMKEIVNGKRITMKNGKDAVKGVCATCGRGLYRIVPKAA